MKQNFDKVWYASYGSNLLRERFVCYIAGGTPKGAHRRYIGCTDTSPPLADRPIEINTEMYFARRSKTWSGGGAAFINPEFSKESTTLGRMYLITTAQFIEVVKQETRFEGELPIDFIKTMEDGVLSLREKSWYNKLLYLGMDGGYPIFTFTNTNFLAGELNSPHEHYLKIIIEGLKETYGLGPAEIEAYLKTKIGIEGTEMQGRLRELIGRSR